MQIPFRKKPVVAEKPAPLPAPMARALLEAEEKAIDPPLKTAPPAPATATKTAMPLWKLTCIDRNEPPFHFHNVAHTVFVAAPNPDMARHLAVGQYGRQWQDEEMTACEEFRPSEPGVIAHLV